MITTIENWIESLITVKKLCAQIWQNGQQLEMDSLF